MVVGPFGKKGFMRGRILANRDLGPGVVTGTWGVLETTPGVLTGFRDKEGAGLVGNGGAGRRGGVADGLASGGEDRGAPRSRPMAMGASGPGGQLGTPAASTTNNAKSNGVRAK